MNNPDLSTATPDELVNLFADKTQRNQAAIALLGGITATQLKRVTLSEEAFQALVKGLKHPNPKVRWWCLQWFDHVGDERCVPYILPLLDDPIPRVRKHAQHALECEICKQSPEASRSVQSALSRHAITEKT